MPYLKYLSSVKRNHIETKQKLIHDMSLFLSLGVNVYLSPVKEKEEVLYFTILEIIIKRVLYYYSRNKY